MVARRDLNCSNTLLPVSSSERAGLALIRSWSSS